ncbi:MAG TPA: ParB/RepB/Spo0J family partition protein [Blastocatellia bacterium]|nr:ParB/RepB/Spo0J family partition protein [Blastocatellia bacterium]
MSRKALGRGLSALFTQINQIESELVDLSLDLIDPTPTQPRQAFNEASLEELAQSIKSNGVIQPIIVRRHGDRYQIVAGERRWRAAQRAGLQKIPCVIKDIPEANVLELSLIENIQREELNPIEEANAYRRLIEKLNVTQEELSQRVGKDRTSIANLLRLLKLPEEIQSMVEDGQLSMGHARALLPIESEEEQIKLAKEIISKTLSVRETERLVRVASEPRVTAKPSTTETNQPDANRANIAAAESKLSSRLGSPVKIKFSGHGGQIEIRFSSPDELTRLFDLLIRDTRDVI